MEFSDKRVLEMKSKLKKAPTILASKPDKSYFNKNVSKEQNVKLIKKKYNLRNGKEVSYRTLNNKDYSRNSSTSNISINNNLLSTMPSNDSLKNSFNHNNNNNINKNLASNNELSSDKSVSLRRDDVTSLKQEYFDDMNNNDIEINDMLVYDNKKDSFGEYYVDCGSLEKILQNLMGFNLSFLTVFLDTFVLFMKPEELFDFLIDQYHKNLPIQTTRSRHSFTGVVASIMTSDTTLSSDYTMRDCEPTAVQLTSNTSIDVDNYSVSNRDITDSSICNKDSTLTKQSTTNNDKSVTSERKDTTSSVTFSCRSDTGTVFSNESNILQKTTRTIALKIFRKWISTYYCDFESNTQLMENLENFLEIAENSVSKKDPLWRQINLVTITLRESKPPTTIQDHLLRDEEINWDILKHQEVAVTLTAIEYELFKKLNLRELLAYVFGNSSERRAMTTSVGKIIENSTRLTYLVETQIVKYPSSKVRALEMETWISVLHDLMDHKNYSSIVAILGALNSTSVDRLEKTKKKLNPKKKKIKNDIEEEVGLSNFYDNLRVYLDNNTHISAIPFLGSYITIFDRLKQSGITTTDNKIKFKTCRHISKLLQSILTRQNYYQCPEISRRKISYMKRILTIPSLSSEEISALSNKHEPKINHN